MKKINYNLKSLLLFWQRQMDDEFRVIQALVDLFEFEKMADEEKLKVYLETLRKYGLYENSYKGKRGDFKMKSREFFLPEDPVKKLEDDIAWLQHSQEIYVECYNVRLMNAVVEFRSIMN